MSAKTRKTDGVLPHPEDAAGPPREYSVRELEEVLLLCARDMVRYADYHFAVLERLEKEIQDRERNDPLANARRILERYGGS